MAMFPAVFDFAKGLYPKESRIAAAKRNAVGGKRKRCIKGKNCSAACIAANMICLVDLPWVGSALTKAAAKIQAAKGKAPAAAKPAATPAPAAKPAAKPTPTVKVKTVEQYKAIGLPFLEAALPLAEKGRAAQTPEGKKVIANVKQAISELKAQSPKAPPSGTAPAAKPATAAPKKKTALDKVPTVDAYKKWGVAMLEEGIKNIQDSPKFNPNSAVSKKAIGNMTEALKQLKAEQAAKADAATAAKAAAKTASAKAAAAAAPKPAAPAATPAPKPAATPTPQPAATPAPQPKPAAPATPPPSSGAKPTPLVRNTTGDMPQPNTPGNPQGLSINQQIVWKKAFGPITTDWFDTYKHASSSGNSPKLLLQQGKADEARIARLLKGAQDNRYTRGLAKIFNQVKVNDKNTHLTEAQLAKLPSSVRGLVQQFGQNKLKKMLLAVNDFTGNDYGLIRNAMRGRPPERSDAKILTPAELNKKIAKYKRKGELIQEFLEAAKNRPAVPKFRGVPASKDLLDNFINLAKTGGTFQEGAMNSWSTNNETAKGFTSPRGTATNRVMFRTLNKLGSSVKELSSHQHESEILTPAGARYKVVNYTPTEVNTYGNKTQTVHFFDVVEY